MSLAQMATAQPRNSSRQKAPPSRRGFPLVAHTGFEPVISALRGRRPRPLDECASHTQAGITPARRRYSTPPPPPPSSAAALLIAACAGCAITPSPCVTPAPMVHCDKNLSSPSFTGDARVNTHEPIATTSPRLTTPSLSGKRILRVRFVAIRIAIHAATLAVFAATLATFAAHRQRHSRQTPLNPRCDRRSSQYNIEKRQKRQCSPSQSTLPASQPSFSASPHWPAHQPICYRVPTGLWNPPATGARRSRPAPSRRTAMDITVDGARLFYLPVGSPRNPPLILLHGGPGLDHTELHPWLDALADDFYLIYVYQRGQGRSERVDPATLSLSRFAADVSALARALGFTRYALLGHSFG